MRNKQSNRWEGGDVINILVVFFILLLPINAFAGRAYKCIIKSAAGLSESGLIMNGKEMKGWEYGNIYTKYIGDEFVVDRATGKMVGAVTNSNAQYGNPIVVDEGSVNQAYKAITVYQPNAHVDYLYIQAFSENSQKPFMFISSDSILGGLCEDY